MATPNDLQIWEWNEMLDSCNGESDRGAAVLIGGFTEHYLGNYLRLLVCNSRIADEMFGATGPMSSFSQRILVAYGFDFITKEHYSNLNLVRRIRNHFAHHPKGTSFGSNEVVQLCKKLSTLEIANESNPEDDALLYRRAYMFACVGFCGYAHTMLVHKYKRIEGRCTPNENTSS